MEAKTFTLEELLKLVSSNKATALQKLELAKLLNSNAQEEAQLEKVKIFEEIDTYINQKGITVNDYLLSKKPVEAPKTVIFDYEEDGNHYLKYLGQKGKWTPKAFIVEKLSYVEALKYAVGDAGKLFVKKLYDK
jgi:hypothetical protein